MTDDKTCAYTPPFVNTGEFSAVERPIRKLSSKGEPWTEEQKKWWAELVDGAKDRNVHFETDSDAGDVE